MFKESFKVNFSPTHSQVNLLGVLIVQQRDFGFHWTILVEADGMRGDLLTLLTDDLFTVD